MLLARIFAVVPVLMPVMVHANKDVILLVVQIAVQDVQALVWVLV